MTSMIVWADRLEFAALEGTQTLEAAEPLPITLDPPDS
jgi:hypothetical protein